MSIRFSIVWCCLILSSQVAANTIHRGNGAEPDSLNIHLAQGLNSHNVLMDMYEGLMTFNAKGEVVPGVIASYQVNDSKDSWEFELRADARWSDGQPVVAKDFMHAWQLAIDPKTAAPYRQLFDPMLYDSQLQVNSDHPKHLRIKLNQPNALFINQLVLPVFFPLPNHTQERHISNGAYQLVESKPHEFITLNKNPHFHAAADVATATVIYWVTENQASELLRFRVGELDITETIPDQQIDWIKKHLPDELRLSAYYGSFFLGLNLADRHLSDLHLRKALNAAINRQILVDKVLKSGQLPASTLIPGAQNQNTIIFNPKAALESLEKSDFQINTDRIQLLYNNSSNQKKVALAVAAMWRQNLGIKTQLVHQEWKAFVLRRQSNNKQVFRGGWIADYPDPLNFLQLFQSQSYFNYYSFQSPEYDQVLQAMTVSTDPAQRARLQNTAEAILAKKLPMIPLYQYVSRHLVSQKISGFENNLMDKHLSRYLQKH